MTIFTFRQGLLPAIFSIVFSLVLAIPAGAGEREIEKAPLSDAPQADTSAAKAGPSLFGLDTALGLVGLPGMSSPADDDESTYEKAWRMQNGPNGTTRLTYGEQYHRNPDGSYGARSLSQWNGAGNVADNLLEQALSAGSGWFSSWAAGWLGAYGKARLSFRLNDEGEVTGAGDFLLPLYDSEYSALFTQLGLRTMPGERVIGNFGLGQRFFPAENLALGYNVFLDQDFSRNHTRGGAGVEAWYDWLRLSANYYTPLSGWKDSRDYDRRLVEERPAEGYDARLTGYLPFYRHLAVTGAFEQWKGDHVGSFGSNEVLQKDPKVWSYGLEWTPVPALSASVNQRHSGSQQETRFGLTFNYHFGMAWEDQLSPATVSEMRTVDGSRHDFVNRQNEMILEYRAKDAYRIEYLGKVGVNTFKFRIMDGLSQAGSGKTVQVAATGAAFAVGAGSASFTANGGGEFIVALDTVTASPVILTIQAGNNTRNFTLTDVTLTAYALAVSGTLTQGIAGSLTLTLTRGNAAQSGVSVTFPASTTINGLPPSATTDANGQIILNTLTALVSANLTLNAVVEGNTLTVPVTVVPNAYTLEAAPNLLTQNTGANVTFTLKQGGTAVGSGVSVTFTANSGFSNLPVAAQTTNANGQFTVTGLTATATGSPTVQATVGGQTVSVPFTVNAPYSLSAFTVTESYSSGTVTKTITVTLSGGSGVSGKQINWTATKGTLAASSSTTDGSGVATITLTHSILESSSVTATVADDSSVSTMDTVYFGPQGAPRFDMATFQESGYTYNQAVAHCGSGGNSLPSLAEMQTLANFYGGNSWWSTVGVSNDNRYRTSDVNASNNNQHWLVNMPTGSPYSYNNNDDNVTYGGVVCLVP